MKKILSLFSVIIISSLTHLDLESRTVDIVLPATPYFKAIKEADTPVAGQSYYLRSSVWFNEDGYRTSNYRGGKLHPINTKITLHTIGDDKATVSFEGSDRMYVIKNEPKYSRRDLQTILKQMLSPTPISLDGIPKAALDNINKGKITEGMTKEQVAMARGIPPGNRNRSLEANTWGYYNSRRNYARVYFSEGVVTQIKEKKTEADDEDKNSDKS